MKKAASSVEATSLYTLCMTAPIGRPKEKIMTRATLRNAQAVFANQYVPEITARSLALFANLGFGTGRRFAGSSSTDVLADRTRLMGRTQVTSLNAAGGAIH